VGRTILAEVIPLEDKPKLRTQEIRYIEALLYNQKSHDSIIAELEAELEEMLPAFSSSIVKFSHNDGMVETSQPEEWTIIRNESVRAKELYSEIRRRKRAKAAISEALQCMTEEECRFVFLRYQQEHSHKQCARALSMWSKKKQGPSNTYWRTRRRVLEKVGRFVLI